MKPLIRGIAFVAFLAGDGLETYVKKECGASSEFDLSEAGKKVSETNKTSSVEDGKTAIAPGET